MTDLEKLAIKLDARLEAMIKRRDANAKKAGDTAAVRVVNRWAPKIQQVEAEIAVIQRAIRNDAIADQAIEA